MSLSVSVIVTTSQVFGNEKRSFGFFQMNRDVNVLDTTTIDTMCSHLWVLTREDLHQFHQSVSISSAPPTFQPQQLTLSPKRSAQQRSHAARHQHTKQLGSKRGKRYAAFSQFPSYRQPQRSKRTTVSLHKCIDLSKNGEQRSSNQETESSKITPRAIPGKLHSQEAWSIASRNLQALFGLIDTVPFHGFDDVTQEFGRACPASSCSLTKSPRRLIDSLTFSFTFVMDSASPTQHIANDTCHRL